MTRAEDREGVLTKVGALLIGDEYRRTTRGPIGKVTAIDTTTDPTLRRVTSLALGERILHVDTLVLKMRPPSPTKSDQRKPR